MTGEKHTTQEDNNFANPRYTAEQTIQPGGDPIRNVMVVERRFTPTQIGSVGTTIISVPEALLGYVNVTKAGGAGSLIKVYDGQDATGKLLATIDGEVVHSWPFDALASDGITVVMSVAAAQITTGHL